MTFEELVQELVATYHLAPQGEAVVRIHLFGIRYADVITNNGYSIRDMLDRAEVPQSYYPEIKKGINLSRYVDIKPEYL